MLYRKIEERLRDYYENSDSKILVVSGARQVGKSYIIRETAKTHFEHYIEVNLQADYDGPKYFSEIKTVEQFYLQLSALYGNNIGNIDDTIVFLDEIQVYPYLLSMLKDLKLDNRYRYIASGSLLGIALRHAFIPMGSIEEVKMYPLDFEEFLIANHVDASVIDYLKTCFAKKERVADNIHKIMLDYFKKYLISGGLPDSVKYFVENQNVYEVRKNQDSTYIYYKDDASKYDFEHNLKIKRIYDFLPSYMENKVKRIKYREIEGNKRANFEKYEDEFDYLISSGCALAVRAASNPVFPLVESSTKNLIKLYYNDVGILTNLLYKNNINAILSSDKSTNLGSVYETAAAMELIAHGHDLYYFDSKKVGEVDFLINDYGTLGVVPIEIKSGNDQTNFRAIPKLVQAPYDLPRGYIFGNDNKMHEEGKLLSLPIYMIMFI